MTNDQDDRRWLNEGRNALKQAEVPIWNKYFLLSLSVLATAIAIVGWTGFWYMGWFV